MYTHTYHACIYVHACVFRVSKHTLYIVIFLLPELQHSGGLFASLDDDLLVISCILKEDALNLKDVNISSSKIEFKLNREPIVHDKYVTWIPQQLKAILRYPVKEIKTKVLTVKCYFVKDRGSPPKRVATEVVQFGSK